MPNPEEPKKFCITTTFDIVYDDAPSDNWEDAVVVKFIGTEEDIKELLANLKFHGKTLNDVIETNKWPK